MNTTTLSEITYKLTNKSDHYMNYELIKATEEYKDVIRNLMQFYIYDFSEFVSSDVEENGLYETYPHLEDYWREVNHRFPYIIKKRKICIICIS